MGVLRDPETYLDKSSLECETQQKAFTLLVQKLARGSASEKEELSKPLLSPDQPNEEGTTEDANSKGGPKTAETVYMLVEMYHNGGLLHPKFRTSRPCEFGISDFRCNM